MVTEIKLKNRRVQIGELEEGIYLGFKRLKKNTYDDKGSITTVTKKTIKTELVISRTAAVALFLMLQKRITLADFVEFEKESGQELITKIKQ